MVLGLGIAVDIPEAEVTHLGYFVLSCLIGLPASFRQSGSRVLSS